MIMEKVFKCTTFYSGYGSLDSLVLELAEEIKKGYHISDIEREVGTSVNTVVKEPDLIVTLRKVEE